MSDDPISKDEEELLNRSAHVREQAARYMRALESAAQREAELVGYASSDDGLVRAKVDSGGVLTKLEVSPETNRRANDLGTVILEVVHRAVAEVRNQVREIYVGLQNEGVIRELPPHALAGPPLPETPQPAVSTPHSAASPRQPSAPAPSTASATPRRRGGIGAEEFDDDFPETWLQKGGW